MTGSGDNECTRDEMIYRILMSFCKRDHLKPKFQPSFKELTQKPIPKLTNQNIPILFY